MYIHISSLYPYIFISGFLPFADIILVCDYMIILYYMYYIHLSLPLARSPSPFLYTKQGGAAARGTNLKFRGAASGAVEDAVCAANLRSGRLERQGCDKLRFGHWVGLRVNLQETMVSAHPIFLALRMLCISNIFQSSHEFALQQSNMECWEIPL